MTASPSGILAAIRLLPAGEGFSMMQMRGDEHYQTRMRLVKAALETDKVLADQCSYAAMLRLMFEALGVEHGKCRPSKEAWLLFEQRCAAVLKAAKPARKAPIGKKFPKTSDAELRARQDALKAELEAAPVRDPKPSDATPGNIDIKKAPPMSTANGTTTVWGLELRDGQWAEPRDFTDAPTVPDMGLLPVIRPDTYRFLQHRHTGTIMVHVGQYMSGGAVCLYNTEGAICAGVVSVASLARFTEKTSVNGTKATVDQEEFALSVLRAQATGSNVNPVAYGYLAAALLSGKEIRVKIDTGTAKKAVAAKKTTAKKAVAAKTTKKTTEKKPATERATSQYTLVKAADKVYEALSPQQRTIIAALKKLGTATKSKLVAALPDVSVNNIGFYLVKWQKENIIKKLPAAS
jgi:hypothetical protein